MKRKSLVPMEKSQFSKLIPEEIILEILSRLPLESLHKFKWVSKSWRFLITGEIFPRTLNTPLVGFIYIPFGGRFTFISIKDDDDAAIDRELSFLPLFPVGFRIVGCCNGLVLLSTYVIGTSTFFVCNPFTKSWTQLPLVDYIPCHNFIDFNPSISPHYKVVSFWRDLNRVFINVYRSERGSWEQKRVNLGDCMVSHYRSSALWDGDLYVHTFCMVGPCRGYEMVRIGLSGGDDDFEIIKPPPGAMHIGRLGDSKLCSASLYGLRLWVWILRGKVEREWMLEHDGTIPDLSGCHPIIVGFHPLRNAVLLLDKSVIFAYDLMEMSLVELCRIGKKGEVTLPSSVFPFVPCSYDVLENRIPPTN